MVKIVPMNFALLPIQIILFIFLIFALSRVLLRLKEGSLPLGAFLFWFAIWLVGIIIVVEPSFTSWFAAKIGIKRGADGVIYFSLAILFYLVFRIYVIIENLKEEISRLTREIALNNKEENKKK